MFKNCENKGLFCFIAPTLNPYGAIFSRAKNRAKQKIGKKGTIQRGYAGQPIR